MKRWFTTLLCFGTLGLFVRCDSDEGDAIVEGHSILGKWKLTEAFISAGGPQYWVDVENGEEINFLDSEHFSSNRYAECTSGKFIVEEEVLSLDYDCEGFETEIENEEGFITYQIKRSENEILLTPISVICIEGCTYKYTRVK